MANRIAVLGALISSLGFFFLPLIELKPNRIAPGLPFHLLQLEGDLRYLVLFALAVLPLFAALRPAGSTRGWLLVTLGNAVLFLTLFLPALAGEQLLAGAAEVLGEGVILSNPRLLPSAALALGLAGAYVVLFAGLRDLKLAGVSRSARSVAAWSGVALVIVFLLAGQFDIYSVVVEFQSRGEQLGRKLLEHTLLVLVSLTIGLVVGIALGLWAARDAHAAPVILYTTGIIQTIPSLALFGLLLAPLARLGDTRALTTGTAFIVTLLAAALLLAGQQRLAGGLAGRARQVLQLLSALVAAVPLALLVVVLSSYLFRVSFIFFTAAGFGQLRSALLLLLVVTFGLRLLSRTTGTARWRQVTRYGSWLGLFALLLVLGSALLGSSRQLLGSTSLAGLTLRDLGVSGIGVAPGVIALTLYSLLPLVRNTYAGLRNVDASVIDAGRGMGMTARQRFLQIELPLALPVIMAGVRNAAVALVGIAAVASIIGAGGLGDFIFSGINNTSIDQILLGTVPAVLLAVLLDSGLQGLERLLASPGMRQARE
jgi:osmoprotectant transport system permease protein